MRLSDDEIKDPVTNGGQPQRLRLREYNNFVDPLTQGLVKKQEYSQYGGSSIYAVDKNGDVFYKLLSNIYPTVSGFTTTVSSDDDKDGNPEPPKYDDKLLVMAHEGLQNPNGTNSSVIVAGGAFMLNFEIQVSVDNAGTLLYSNYNITENILLSLNRVQPIADAWKMPPDSSVIVEGFAEGKDSKKGRVESYLIVNKDNDNTNNIVKPNDSSAGKESSGKSPITSDGNLTAYILLLVASGTIIALKKKKSTIR